MNYNPDIHHRQSIRLKGFDYSQPGAYFVTICTNNHENLFGEIENNSISLNKFGIIVSEKWNNIHIHFKNVILGEYIIMPNHLHGIIVLIESDERAKHFKTSREIIENENTNASPLREILRGTESGSLSAIIQNFISVSSRKINKIRQIRGVKVWQRGFYERIIRNNKELNAIRNYIINNPMNWEMDENNPKNFKDSL